MVDMTISPVSANSGSSLVLVETVGKAYRKANGYADCQDARAHKNARQHLC
jgi:hypothetical protein